MDWKVYANLTVASKAVELNPQSGRAHFELGVAGRNRGLGGSAVQLESAVSELSSIRIFISRWPMTSWAGLGRGKSFRALANHPDHYRANLFLGQLWAYRTSFCRCHFSKLLLCSRNRRMRTNSSRMFISIGATTERTPGAGPSGSLREFGQAMMLFGEISGS
jgi:hypothetical protein